MHNVPNGPTGEAMSAPDLHTALVALDPMLALVRAYEAEREHYNASDDADGELLHALEERLTRRPPPAHTAEGAIAALRLAADDLEAGVGSFQAALVAEALTFLRTADA